VNKAPAVGFIGFGEAGSTIAGGLRGAGIDRLVAFDINARTPVLGPNIQARASDSRTMLAGSSEELVRAADILLSTVTSSSAFDAARQTAPFLQPRQIYADLNSVSPALKRQIAQVIDASGARFVEAAVMAPVLPYGHRVPMLLGGEAAQVFADAMTPFGMRLEVLASAGIGSAAAVKMCRSIVVKGLEAPYGRVRARRHRVRCRRARLRLAQRKLPEDRLEEARGLHDRSRRRARRAARAGDG
jgi:3-hydroxyisobutyrate dehydrogenase-like beta-hydroxyacid dehydrogenase